MSLQYRRLICIEMFTFGSSNEGKSPLGLAYTRALRKARKPTPVTDHQGAATPPMDRAYLRDLSHTCTYTHVHMLPYMCMGTHTYVPSILYAQMIRTYRETIGDGIHGRTSGAMAVFGLLSDSRARVLPPRGRNKYVKGQNEKRSERDGEAKRRQHNRRVKIYPV